MYQNCSRCAMLEGDLSNASATINSLQNELSSYRHNLSSAEDTIHLLREQLRDSRADVDRLSRIINCDAEPDQLR